MRPLQLQEYIAKRILSERYGVKIPRGEVAETPEEAAAIAEKLGRPVVLKSQILVGGRGKAGAIRTASSPEEAARVASELLGRVFKGHIVRKLYVEEKLEIERELYVGLSLDRVEKAIALIVSSEGGMDVEEIAEKSPEKLLRLKIHPLYGLWDHHVRRAVQKLSLPDPQAVEASTLIRALYKAMVELDAELIEVNPLVLTASGELVAADVRLFVDDYALFRHRELESVIEYTQADALERMASEMGLNYVKLEGNVGILANGAGMAMATMDLVQFVGGRPANFLDVGGGASSEVVERAIELILTHESVRVVFMNIFGGITRCDEVARGIVEALRALRPSIPFVIRLTGTNEEEGRAILEEFSRGSGLAIYVVSTMEEGAKLAAQLAGG
ncbi:MAG: ADP-forming succinate--CoA ligase subunit beta [Fervidicoccaceae archaeon]